MQPLKYKCGQTSLKFYSLQIRDAGIQEELEQYLQGSGENYWIGLTRWNWEWKVIAGKLVYNMEESNSDRSGSTCIIQKFKH